jgi:hypothetical protein
MQIERRELGRFDGKLHKMVCDARKVRERSLEFDFPV